jgi:hypothetical protein
MLIPWYCALLSHQIQTKSFGIKGVSFIVQFVAVTICIQKCTHQHFGPGVFAFYLLHSDSYRDSFAAAVYVRQSY